MNILSWNVWRLTDLSRKYSICDTKYRLGNIDVLCLQEVKVSRFLLDLAYHVIWLDGVIFFLNMKLVEVELLLFSPLIFFLLLFLMVLTPCKELFGFCCLFKIILLELLISMLLMM